MAEATGAEGGWMLLCLEQLQNLEWQELELALGEGAKGGQSSRSWKCQQRQELKMAVDREAGDGCSAEPEEGWSGRSW